MHRHKFHEIWVLPLLVLFLYHTNTFAQCPLTKSATFKMLPQGIPNRIELAPTDFLLNATDTAFYKKLSLSQDRFLCVDVGIQEVILSGVNVTSNDTFACPEYVWVIDSVLLCSEEMITPKAVAGRVTTEQGELVPNVAIGLSSGAVNYFRGTNERGTFFFDDFEAEQFELAPGDPFDNNVRNGITTFDVLLLQKHILNLRPLDSPYKLIAADLNNSGDITAFDMLLLRQMILSVINEFPNTPSWRFVDAAHEFEDAMNPFNAPIPSSIPIDAINAGPQLDNRFIAIKMGDLNNTVKLGATGRNNTKIEAGKPILKITEKVFKKGEIVNVQLALTKELAVEGVQFALGYDAQKLRFLGLDGTAELREEHYTEEKGLITMSWTNPEAIVLEEAAALINLQFRATAAGLLSELIHLIPHQLAPIIYTEIDGSIPFSIDWETPNVPIKTFEVFDNYPNPFITHTNISFLLPASSEVTLTVFDNNGRTILTKQQDFTAGKQTIRLNEKLPTAGLYFYRLESQFGVSSGRMNYVEL
ncbi:MAG: T9SS type A sorting domain-containing protein [Saprospiraceae bacterium]